MYLIATAETPNSAPAAAPRSSPSAAGGDPHERGADREDRALDGDQRRQRGALRVAGAGAGESDDDQSCRGDRHSDPLSSSELKAEESLREHGEEDEPAGEDGLHDRQGRER